MTYNTPRSLNEWIKFYEEKSGDKFEIPKGAQFHWTPTRGFSVFIPDIEGKILLIYMTCGDGHFWRDVGEMMALSVGLTHLMTICIRKIEPYIRFWGWKKVTTSEVDGQKRFFCLDNMGRNVVITHRGVDEKTGIPTYYVTQYLIPGEEPVFLNEGDEKNDRV